MLAFYIFCASLAFLAGVGAVGGWLWSRYDKGQGDCFCLLAVIWPVVLPVLIGMWLFSVVTTTPKPRQKGRPW